MDVNDEIRANRGLAVRIAARSSGSRSFDERLADAMVGLWKAIRDYDETKGASFKTYATKRIRGEILDGARRDGAHTRDAIRNGNAPTPIPLDSPVDGLRTVADCLVDERDTLAVWWEEWETVELLKSALPIYEQSLARISKRNQYVVRERIAGRHFRAIGEDLGISESRTHAIWRLWLRHVNAVRAEVA